MAPRKKLGKRNYQQVDKGAYMPTPEEIKAAQAEIQAGWDEGTEMSRRDGRPYTVSLKTYQDPYDLFGTNPWPFRIGE